jgi:hypothetical protein
MRGHIGFKIGNKPSPIVRITALRGSVLVTEAPAPTTRITSLRAAVLATAAPQAPEAPEFVIAGSIDSVGTIELLFSPIVDNKSPITSYVVQHSTNGTTWTTINVSAATVEAASSSLVGQKRCVISGLTIGTEYAFRLAGVNAIGTGDFNTVIPTTIPTVANDFTPYVDDVFYTYSSWMQTTVVRTSTKVYGLNVFTYTVNNVGYVSLTAPIAACFLTHISGGAAESGTCSQSALSLCLYEYDYQMQEANGAPVLQDWGSVYTTNKTLFDQDSNPAYVLPEYPQALIFTPTISGRSIALEQAYWLRCVVTRKSDDATVISEPIRVIFSE